jgi:hypothetical protein
MDSDTKYFRQRASEEREAALQTQNPEARRVHQEMAERYEDLARGIAVHQQKLGLDTVQPRDAIEIED